jgi:hypothetical protein
VIDLLNEMIELINYDTKCNKEYFAKNLSKYSNPKWFVEGHPVGVSFHKQKNTNDIGLL